MSAPEQLDLFAVEEQPVRPVTMVTVCSLCGVPVDAMTVADVGAPWKEPVLWGWVAQQEHNEREHPERARRWASV